MYVRTMPRNVYRTTSYKLCTLKYRYLINCKLEGCNPWSHVANRRISISQLLSFATELATPSITDECTYVTYGHLTAFNILRLIIIISRLY